MRLGIGLPNTLHGADSRLILDWARVADDAGFHVLGTIDKPNYDSWDPLATLAAAAAVTERIRLATTILQLPNRNEVLVAKQAAVIDTLSAGRLDLGVALGGRQDDFDVLGASFDDRARRFSGQVRRIRQIWQDARGSDERHGVLGPAPASEPGPPIWIGAMSDPGMRRAVRIGDGFVFAGAGPDTVGDAARQLREQAAARGKTGFTIASIAYVAVGDDPETVLDEAARQLVRYYGQLWADPKDIVLHGPPAAVAEGVARYAEAGIDVLVVFPEVPNILQVHRLAEGVLPAYAAGNARPSGRAQQAQDDASQGSFPASDPPAYMPASRRQG